MGISDLLLIAVGLSMDAFAVAVSCGLVLCFIKLRPTLRIAGSFGLFQGIMPLIGFAIANTFSDKFAAVDHWIAFGLLSFVGGKMLWEAIKGEEELPADPSRWDNVLVMAAATSIDALAVGASFALRPHKGIFALSYGYLLASAVIASITFSICAAGFVIGCRFGNKFGKKAEIIGGLVLIGIGIKILLEDLILS